LGSYSGGCGEFCFLKYGPVDSGESQPTFGRNILPTTSAAFCLLHAGLLFGFLSSSQKMEATYSSETLFGFHRPTRRYIQRIEHFNIKGSDHRGGLIAFT
jgi:hypothetical protein